MKSGNGGEDMKPEKGITISKRESETFVELLLSRVRLMVKLSCLDKRPFFVGSRYGRSQSDLTNMDENGKSNNLQRIVPRNDRFFFGSRYGKRSSPITAKDDDQNQMLTCFYSGIANIFRCVE